MNPFPPIPIGAVLPYAGPLASTENNPPTVDIAQIAENLRHAGWLFCDGSQYSCATYWQLYAVISNAYGGDSTNFLVPDLRGRFMRGVDGGANRDPEATQRTTTGTSAIPDGVGSTQADAFQGHEHYYNEVKPSPAAPTLGPGDAPTDAILPQQPTQSQVAEGKDGDPRVSSETRPINIYLNYIIRWR